MPSKLDGRVSGEKLMNIIHADLTHVYVYWALCTEREEKQLAFPSRLFISL